MGHKKPGGETLLLRFWRCPITEVNQRIIRNNNTALLLNLSDRSDFRCAALCWRRLQLNPIDGTTGEYPTSCGKS